MEPGTAENSKAAPGEAVRQTATIPSQQPVASREPSGEKQSRLTWLAGLPTGSRTCPAGTGQVQRSGRAAIISSQRSLSSPGGVQPAFFSAVIAVCARGSGARNTRSQRSSHCSLPIRPLTTISHSSYDQSPACCVTTGPARVRASREQDPFVQAALRARARTAADALRYPAARSGQ